MTEEELKEVPDPRHLGAIFFQEFVGGREGEVLVPGEAADLQVDVLVLGHEALLHLDLRPRNGIRNIC